jgi:hypothetical protein
VATGSCQEVEFLEIKKCDITKFSLYFFLYELLQNKYSRFNAFLSHVSESRSRAALQK